MSQCRSRSSILLVEDNNHIREALQCLLEGEGYLVRLASNGQEALEVLASNSLPDLILLNLEMPIMDGFQFREVQKQDPKIASIPVILMSAADPPLIQEGLRRAQFQAYLLMPTDLGALLVVIKRLLHCPPSGRSSV